MKSEKNNSSAKRYFLNVLFALMSVTVLVTSGCSLPDIFAERRTRNAQPRPNGNTPLTPAREMPENAPRIQEQAPTNNDESEMLVGTWRYSYNSDEMSCRGEISYGPDGRYSTLDTCIIGGYTVQILKTGDWSFIARGVVLYKLRDYEPKEDVNGRPVRMPENVIADVSFQGRNQFTTRDRAYSNISIVYYRVA